MLGFIIMMLVVSFLMGCQRGMMRLLGGFFAFMAFMYGFRILLFAGFHLLPLIILIWAIGNIIVPFTRGFMSKFQ